ncbi:MAG: AmmeMemoRadiSam system protein B [Planctomycetota bacterium]|jgi:AmmeMemoRadiSam system protein B/AmmeMemoRadiSam system protein A
MSVPRSILTVLAILPPMAAFAWQAAADQDDPTVRPAYVAGSWYPGDSARLANQVDGFLAAAPASGASGKPIALVSPHAGYRFSGPAAAAGYAALRGQSYKRVIVLAFSHRNAGRYDGVDVPADLTAYQTPLGKVPIDRQVCDDLLDKPGFASHPGIDRGEHSLELQLPFLQRVVTEFRLVPLLVGRMTQQDYARAAQAIVPWVDAHTLVVASTDFTHFGPNYGYQPFKDDIPEQIQALANQAAAPIIRCDFDGFANHLAKTNDTICGRGPVTLLLRILSMQGGAQATRAAYDTSGQIMNDWTNSVTYQSFVFTRRPGTLDERERRELLGMARRTVSAHLTGDRIPDPNAEKLPVALRSDGGCFVTLENHGRLRGCIGNMQAVGPLYQAVIRNAVSACQDQRFVNDPVTAQELDELDLEISYLTPMKPVINTDDIIVGRHGLLIAVGNRRGVLLPQVAYERGWTREDFLAQTCRKAGLPLGAWKQPEAKIYSFEAEVFAERD